MAFRSVADDGASVGELRVALENMRLLLEAAGSKSPATDLKTLSDALRPHDTTSVMQFCALAREGFRMLAAKPKASKAAMAPLGPIDEAKVLEHVTRLRDAGTNREAFDLAMTKLKGDKSLKAPEVGTIARQITLSVTNYKSTRAAHTDIEKAFVRQARFENKIR